MLGLTAQYTKDINPIATLYRYSSSTGAYESMRKNVKGGDAWKFSLSYDQGLGVDFRLMNKNTQETILKKNRSFAEALEYVDAHYLEPITLETVADACYLNKYYLSHLFSKEQNMSVGQYIIKRRVDEARHLLENGNQSVSSVAELAGFNDFSYFCRAFKRLTGMTPMQYRRRAQK